MKRELLHGKIKRRKPRLGIHPTRIEKDRTVYDRKVKHRGQKSNEGEGHTVTMTIRQRMPLFGLAELTHGSLS